MVIAAGKRVLVVEDEQDMAELLTSRLEAEGFKVHTEAYGKSALSYAAAHRPDLVILDLRLPDLPGYQVCRGLRKMYNPWDLPILMLTAMDQPIDRLRGLGFGADFYLTKPFNADDLLTTIGMLLVTKAARDGDMLVPT